MTSPRIGLGCMRLSTEPDRDEARGVAVLHAAFDAGVTLLDTADAYCWDDSERGHNERLIAAALATWTGDRSRIRVATKGGLTRPDGRWEADGRARHLAASCDASRRALGVDTIHLYQLHAPDPRTPLSTSVRALAALKRDRLIEAIGLSNVTVGQIEEARRITPIDSIQVELSVWHDEHFLSGVVDYCLAHRIQLLAHRPLGGPSRRQRTMTDPAAPPRTGGEVALVMGLPGAGKSTLAEGLTARGYYRLICPHAAGPPRCWCRKPLPGLGVVFVQRYRLDPAQCIYVGGGPQDRGFARRLGFEYRDAGDFFKTSPVAG